MTRGARSGRRRAAVGGLVAVALLTGGLAIHAGRPASADSAAPLFDCGNGLPCTSGSLLTLPQNAPLTVTTYGPQGQLVQGSAASAWYPIEAEARAVVSAIHQVPNDDRILAVARDEVRAFMFTRLIDIIQRQARGDTLTDQETAALNAFHDAVAAQRSQGAADAVAEYDKWDTHKCDFDHPYQPPGGFGFDPYDTGGGCALLALGTGGPPMPSVEQFEAYGNADAYQAAIGSADAAAVAGRLDLVLSLSTALVTAALASLAAALILTTFPALSAAIATTFGSVAVASAMSFTSGLSAYAAANASLLASGAITSVGAGMAASLVGVLLVAIIVTVLGAIHYIDNATERDKLVQAQTEAGNVDLAAIASTPVGTLELFNDFVLQTVPDYGTERDALYTPPSAWSTGQPKWHVIDAGGAPTDTAYLTTANWDGQAQQTFIDHGYFVTSVLGGPWKASLTLQYLGAGEQKRVVGISRDQLLDVGSATQAKPAQTTSFQPEPEVLHPVVTASVIGAQPPTVKVTVGQAVIGSPFTFTATATSDDPTATFGYYWYVDVDPSYTFYGQADYKLCGTKPALDVLDPNSLVRCPWHPFQGASVTTTPPSPQSPGDRGGVVLVTDATGAVVASQRFSFALLPEPVAVNVDDPSARVITDGDTVTVSGSITGNFDVFRVAWGDGTATEKTPSTTFCFPLTGCGDQWSRIANADGSLGGFAFSFTHQYTYLGSSPHPNGFDAITASAGPGSPTVTIPLTVTNKTPDLEFKDFCIVGLACLFFPGARDLFGTTEPAVVDGFVADVPTATHRVTVSWGDGTTETFPAGCTTSPACPGQAPPWRADMVPLPYKASEVKYFQMQHRYAAAGTYVTTVTADDGGPNGKVSTSRTLRIQAPPVAADRTLWMASARSVLAGAAPGLLAGIAPGLAVPLTASLATAPARGNVAVNPDGSFSYTRDPAMWAASGYQSDSFSVKVTDALGQSTTFQVTVAVDAAAPQPQPTLSPPPVNGWNSGPVQVQWNWSDAGSGIDPAACTTSTMATSEGVGYATATCADKVGNVGLAAEQVQIDTRAPTASPALSPAPTAAGWNNSDVTISWNWSDNGGAGLADGSCTPSTVVAGSGPLVVASPACQDVLGHVATPVSQVVNIDRVAPTAAPTVPALPASGWYTSNVTVAWNWTDTGGAGIDPASCTTSSTSTGEGSAVKVAATCSDQAGNVGTASVTLPIDKTAPDLSPVVTPNPVLLNGAATAVANATDAVSQVQSSSCGPISTSTLGGFTVSCTAKDKAGNVAGKAAPYVVGVAVTSFAPAPRSKYKAGSLVPVKFQLSGANGVISPTLAAQLASACSVTVTADGLAPVCASFSTTNNQFIANVRLPSGAAPGTVVPLVVRATVGGTVVAILNSAVVISS